MREAPLVPFMALPGATLAAAAASAFLDAVSFMLSALVSVLASVRAVVSWVILTCRVSALASLASSCFLTRCASLAISLWAASSLFKLAMS